jgi:hypothetical protein
MRHLKANGQTGPHLGTSQRDAGQPGLQPHQAQARDDDLAKAKAARSVAEKMVTLGKSGTDFTAPAPAAEGNHARHRSENAGKGQGIQIAKSVYSGFTASVGGNSIPAPTVAFVPCSIKMNEPVSRLVL